MSRKLMLLGIFATLLLVVAGIASAQLRPRMSLPSGLITEMTLEGARVTDTRSVNIRVTLTNRTESVQAVLVRGTPFKPHLDGPIFEVTRGTEVLPYYGRWVSYGEPILEEYLILTPGESRVATVNLGPLYEFNLPGEYRVRLNSVMRGTTSTRPLDRQARDREWAGALSSNEIMLSIAPEAIRDFVPLSVLFQSPELPGVTANGWTFQGFNPETQNDAQNAISKAISMAGVAKLMAEAALGEPSQWTIKWFGNFNATRAATVAGKWASIVTGFGVAKKNTLVFDGILCDPGDFAYTFPATEPNTIYLCDGFWSAPAFGYDSRPGTLIHEMSHLKAGTVAAGEVYGTSNCLSLAALNPGQAVQNADNYEFFAEDLNLKTKEAAPALPVWGAAALMALLAAVGIAMLARGRNFENEAA